MGLDIYVRWGEVDEDGDDIDFPEDMRRNQITGMINAPEVGYLRHNWTSVRRMSDFAIKYDGPNPITDMFPAWNGHNGETLHVTGDVLPNLLALRNRTLDYLGNKPYSKRDAVMGKMNTDAERQDAIDEFDYYRQCLSNLVGFINFVELHKDKYNLRIYFG